MGRSKPLLAAFLLAFGTPASGAATPAASPQGTPVGFVETFALAEDRGAVLDQLVRGSEEHFFYSCLHLQQQGDLAAVDGLLKDWRKSGRSGAYRQIETRQRLLQASNDPEATYRFLESELGLKFQHRRQVPGLVPDLPTRFDASKIDLDVLVQRLIKKGRAGAIDEFTGPVLESLVRTSLSKSQRARLLDRLPRPDVPGLVELVLADLNAYPKSTFGSRQIHAKLTLDQLEALRGRRPALLSNRAYVDAVMRRLAPSADESMDDPADRAAYLERALRFAAILPDTFNSLKAHLLYRRLVLDLDLGTPDQERLLRYLRLPRDVHYVKLNKRERAVAANLGQAFDGATPFQPIGTDEPVVTGLMASLLRDAGSYGPYLRVLPERFVQRVWAETKLLAGADGDIDGLVRMLGGPAAAERLKDRVDLEFARTNPSFFAADDAVSLGVDVKNVDTLLVKVFEIDAVAYFDAYGKPVSASLDLDGLIANDERPLELDDPPLRRARRTIDLPTRRRPGPDVVELIGGGVSSRAVVRKGELHLLERVGAAGHVFQVLDGSRDAVPAAVLRFGGRDFEPDERGEIVVPFTTQPGRKPVLLRAGGVASVTYFEHAAEEYALDLAAHVPSEALLAGETATLIARPRLSVNGERVALDLLENTLLTVTAVDLDGTASTRVFDVFELDGLQEIVETLQVPERLASLSVQMTATVRSISRGEDVALASQARSVEINGAARTAHVAQAFLTRLPGAFAVDVRGRNGEPLADRRVRVTVRPAFIDESISQDLKTDAAGRVHLGALVGVRSVEVSGPAGASGKWDLDPIGALGLAGELRGLAGVDLRLPFANGGGDALREDVSLIEMRGGVPLRDRFDALALEGGYVVLRGLPAGEYALTRKDTEQALAVRIVDGVARFGHVVGARQAYQATPALPLSIASVAVADGALRVRLGGVTGATRVHVLTSRYEDRYDGHARLALDRRSGGRWGALARPLSSYESGRAISDEYRYILERRLLDPFPGNMLARAGVLLNPWALRDTSDRMASAGALGETYATGIGGGAGGRYGGRFGGRRRLGASATTPELDFLAAPATVLAGLSPDDDGFVTIPIADLGENHMVRVVAVDDDVAVVRDLVRPERPIALRERRLADALDPAKPMTQQRRIAFVRAGESVEILDAPNANARTFDTLGDVFRLFRTTGASEELVKFEFLTRWPSLSDDDKRAKYSEYVCHELNAFLREKDPEFFAGVVAPYIANKGHRTFMDDWLLETDLTLYLEPWRFDRLNVVEQILLLKRTDGRAQDFARDQYGLVPRGTFSLDEAFEAVLASGGLDAGEQGLALALEEKRKEVAQLKAPSLRAGAGGGGYRGPATPGPEAPSGAALGAEVRALGLESNADAFFLGRLQAVVADEAVELEESLDALGYELDREAVAGLERARGRKADKRRRESTRAFFRDLDPTQELAETHYWRVPLGSTNAGLVTVSPFWVDFAASDGTFVSSWFPTATRSHTEMLLALAFLDLPFEAAEHAIASEGRSVRMTAGSPLLLALEDIAPAARADASSILVGQDFFRLDRRTEVVDGVERERFVTGEFLVGVPYGCRMVITNPSSAPVELQALVQIPVGAIALTGTRVTRGHPLTIPAYGTQALETIFYFPAAGSFGDYPVHAGAGGVLLGAADPRVLQVVDTLSQEDTGTWEWVSQNADLAGVLAYLEANNVRALDLAKVTWRMAERESFDAITGALARRNHFAPVLWQYGVKHRDDRAARRYLEANAQLVARVEAPFRSPLLGLDARDRASYEHLAYEPLVNGRTHEFGGERRILNDQFAAQYTRFLRAVALQSELADEDWMELAYYMLLQDRIGEALAAFDRVDRDLVATGIQYDYMAAYMDFYRGDIEHARQIAAPYVTHPVERWRSRFENVIAHLDEIEGIRPVEGFDRDDRDQTQGALAGSEPILDLTVESGRVTLAHERIDEVEVRYHLMDVEFLFSTNPFVRGDEGAFGFIRPNKAVRVALPVDQSVSSFAVPDEFRRSNLLVEVRGGGIARRATYFSGSLRAQGMERYGQVRVVESDSSKPLPRAYVKVYARLANGQVRFHKDGYTDLRGRFDYVSVSGWDGAPVERYAVLVMHDDAGATITELAPPVR
ncbi:MAG: hypothetical protein AAGB93_12580 [Planctomycetota bacterium]